MVYDLFRIWWLMWENCLPTCERTHLFFSFTQRTKWIWFLVERLGTVDPLEQDRRGRLCNICLDKVFLDVAPIAQALKANIRMEHYTSNKKISRGQETTQCSEKTISQPAFCEGLAITMTKQTFNSNYSEEKNVIYQKNGSKEYRTWIDIFQKKISQYIQGQKVNTNKTISMLEGSHCL